MRRWDGCRWVEYASDESQPDEAPLLDILPSVLREESPDDERIYPCASCGKMRSKNEGGTVFTVCDECWNKEIAS